MYRAKIYFEAYEDTYEEGEAVKCDNIWNDTLEANTKEELKTKIVEAVYAPKFEDLDDEQANKYEHATEYSYSYLANADNQGEATKAEIESWKKGFTRLWAINCHIMVTEVTEKKAIL